jgi:hypothetical protein
MGKNTLKRSLIVGIVFLFLSTTCIPVLAGEGLPDLSIERFDFVPVGDPQINTYATVKVKNIGDVGVDTYQVSYSVRRLVLLKTVASNIYTDINELDPGQSTSDSLIDTRELPKFGLFRFTCNIISDYEESNYDNNLLVVNCLAIAGIWIVL